jgi:hypothetical protein
LKAEELADVIPSTGSCALLAPYLAAKRYDAHTYVKPVSPEEAEKLLPKTADERSQFFEAVLTELSKGEDATTKRFLESVGMRDIPDKWKTYRAKLAEHLQLNSATAVKDFSLPKGCWASEPIAISLFVLNCPSKSVVPLNLFVMNSRLGADESTSVCTLDHLMYKGQNKPSGGWYSLYDILHAASHENNVVLQSDHFYFLAWPIKMGEKLNKFIESLRGNFITFRNGIQKASEEELAEATKEIFEWCQRQYSSSVSLSSSSASAAPPDSPPGCVVDLFDDFKEIGISKNEEEDSRSNEEDDKSIITVQVKTTRKIVRSLKDLKTKGKPKTLQEIDEMWDIIQQIDI